MVAAAVVAATMVAGCGRGTPPVPSTPAPPGFTPAPSATGPDDRPGQAGSAGPAGSPGPQAAMDVAAGPVTLLLTLPGGDVHAAATTGGADQDGAVPVTVDPAGVPSGVLDIAVPSGWTLTAYPDGSLGVHAGDGSLAGGITAPAGGGRFALLGADRAELRLPPAQVPARTAGFTLGAQGLVSATWGTREGGRSLAVVPTGWARGAGDAGRELVWAQVVAAHPDTDTASMHDQLTCHAIGASNKASWNLEPWRPDVGLVAMMVARCNPA